MRTAVRCAMLAFLLAWALAAHGNELAVQPLALATGERAAQPSVAVDPREGFVVTWQERDDGDAVLRFAVIGVDGSERRRGEIARGSDWFVNGADFPNLAVLDNGDWLTFYLHKTSPGTYSYEIRTLRSRDAGASWEPPVLIHRDGTDTEHGFVSLLPAGGDRVRAVWLDGRHMAGGHGDHDAAELMTLRTATLGRDGVPRDERELDGLTCACCQTDIARVGTTVRVAYRNRTEQELRDVWFVELRGDAWSTPQPLHVDGWTIAACPVNGPALASDGERFAALWPTMADGDMAVHLAVGSAQPPTTLARGAAELGRVDLAAWRGGWLATRVAMDAGRPALWLSRLDADGSVRGEQRLADKVGGYPRLASDGEVALLVWAEQGDGPGTSRIGLARIGPTPAD